MALSVVGIYLLLGAVAGLLAGLLGVGGGLIIVPALAWIFTQQGYQPEIIMHMAVATSLATIVLTSLSSMRAHHKKGSVHWPVFVRLSPGIVLGALAGAGIVDYLPTRALQIFFALFVFAVAAQLMMNLRPPRTHRVTGRISPYFAGSGIGLISTIVGIGGGSLTVPWLLWNQFSVREAVATSSACGLPIALAGVTGFMIIGADTGIEYSWGYIYWPAFILISATSIFFAPAGAALAHKIDGQKLKWVFALFLGVVGILMLFR